MLGGTAKKDFVPNTDCFLCSVFLCSKYKNGGKIPGAVALKQEHCENKKMDSEKGCAYLCIKEAKNIFHFNRYLYRTALGRIR